MAKTIKTGDKKAAAKKPAAANEKQPPQSPGATENTGSDAPKAPPEPPKIVLETRYFRKRPIKITAFQWFPELGEYGGVIMQPVGELGSAPPEGAEDDRPRKPIVETLEGDMTVKPGDFIITGVKGEIYRCEEEIFHMTYEEVQETDIPDPTKLPETTEQNVSWVIVRFANGDSFKIAAKYLAQKRVNGMTAEEGKKEYARLLRAPAELVTWASQNIGWNEIAMIALGYQAPAQTDRPAEWSTAFKTIELEPKPREEKKHVPPPSDIKTANQEDAELAKKNVEKDDDPETWQD